MSPTRPEEAKQFREQLEPELRAAKAVHVSVESAVYKNVERMQEEQRREAEATTVLRRLDTHLSESLSAVQFWMPLFMRVDIAALTQDYAKGMALGFEDAVLKNAESLISRAEETRTKARNAVVVLMLSFLLLFVYRLRQRQREERQHKATLLLEKTTALNALDVDVDSLESRLGEGRSSGVSGHVLMVAEAKLKDARSRQERRDEAKARLKALTEEPPLHVNLIELSTAIREAEGCGVGQFSIKSAKKTCDDARSRQERRDGAEARLKTLSKSVSPTRPEEAKQFREQLEPELRAAKAAHVSVESAVYKNVEEMQEELLNREIRCYRNSAV